MKLKLARTTLDGKPKVVDISKIEEELPKKNIFYFDRENDYKDLQKFIEYFESKGYNVYLREVRYGL
ncbi:MAG: hypothetical protein GXO02_01625, partial [Epsilonproteobacteria bacterium]|nr:hypothetical protein [Campylobacterota bacterium]